MFMWKLKHCTQWCTYINNVSARYFLILHERARVYDLSLNPTSNCEWYLLLRRYASQMQDLMFIIYGATTCIYYLSDKLYLEEINSDMLYTRYPIVARALGLAAASREQRYLAYIVT